MNGRKKRKERGRKKERRVTDRHVGKYGDREFIKRDRESVREIERDKVG